MHHDIQQCIRALSDDHLPELPPLIKGALGRRRSDQPARQRRRVSVQPGHDDAAAGGARRERRRRARRRQRLTGPPKETITLSVEIDATDQLEQANRSPLGHLPDTVGAGDDALPEERGRHRQHHPLAHWHYRDPAVEGPFILFVWGPQRVLPVRLTSLNITEEAYDPMLNPIRAKAELSLSVLSYHDLALRTPATALFLAHQHGQGSRGTLNVVNSAHNSAGVEAVMNPSRPIVFPPTSRYHPIDTAMLVAPDGTEVVYLRRRFVPPSDRFALSAGARVVARRPARQRHRPLPRRPASSSGGCAMPTTP